MISLQLLVLTTLAICAYANCGCLKCNRDLTELSQPGSPVKIIYRNIDCSCQKPRRHSYSVQVPVTPDTSCVNRHYGYYIQPERINRRLPCPIPRSYDFQVQVPVEPRKPVCLNNLRSWTDRILITPNCPPTPENLKPVLEPLETYSDDYGYDVNNYDANGYVLLQNSRYASPKTTLSPHSQKSHFFYKFAWKPQSSQTKTIRYLKIMLIHEKNTTVINGTRSKRSPIWPNGQVYQPSADDYYGDHSFLGAPPASFPQRSPRPQPILQRHAPCKHCSLHKRVLGKANPKGKVSLQKKMKSTALKHLKPLYTKGKKQFQKWMKFFKDWFKKSKPLEPPSPHIPFELFLDRSKKINKRENVLRKPLLARAKSAKKKMRRVFNTTGRTKRSLNARRLERMKGRLPLARRNHKEKFFEDEKYSNEISEEEYDEDNDSEEDSLGSMFKHPPPPAEHFLKTFHLDHLFHPTSMIHFLNTPIRVLNHLHKVSSHIEPIIRTVPEVAKASRQYLMGMVGMAGKNALRLMGHKVAPHKHHPLAKKRRLRRNTDEEEVALLQALKLDIIKSNIIQLSRQVESIKSFDTTILEPVFHKLAVLQNYKSKIVRHLHAQGDKSGILEKLYAKMAYLHDKIVLDIIEKLSEPRQSEGFRSRLIKLLVRMQKLRCLVKILETSEHEKRFCLFYLERLDLLKDADMRDISSGLKRYKEEETLRLENLVRFLKELVESGDLEKIDGQSKILWEMNNANALQELSLKELKVLGAVSGSVSFRIKTELKILYDLQKHLDSCEEAQKVIMAS